jgi:hypothetical protein
MPTKVNNPANQQKQGVTLSPEWTHLVYSPNNSNLQNLKIWPCQPAVHRRSASQKAQPKRFFWRGSKQTPQPAQPVLYTAVLHLTCHLLSPQRRHLAPVAAWSYFSQTRECASRVRLCLTLQSEVGQRKSCLVAGKKASRRSL